MDAPEVILFILAVLAAMVAASFSGTMLAVLVILSVENLVNRRRNEP